MGGANRKGPINLGTRKRRSQKARKRKISKESKSSIYIENVPFGGRGGFIAGKKG